MSWMLCQNGSSLAPWKRYFNFLVFYLSGALEKVFLSQKVIQAEYIPGGPVGYGASS